MVSVANPGALSIKVVEDAPERSIFQLFLRLRRYFTNNISAYLASPLLGDRMGVAAANVIGAGSGPPLTYRRIPGGTIFVVEQHSYTATAVAVSWSWDVQTLVQALSYTSAAINVALIWQNNTTSSRTMGRLIITLSALPGIHSTRLLVATQPLLGFGHVIGNDYLIPEQHFILFSDISPNNLEYNYPV